MTLALDILASMLLLSGVALTVLAGIGLLRFPDVLTRMHAQTKPAVLGVLLVLAGTGLATRSAGLSATLLLVAAFQVLTSPVGAHMIGRAAYRAGHSDRRLLVRDDLASPDDLAPRDEPGTGAPER
jgi:multicomponent Na+:H+ antiporter subunit G